jgi:hypothetical protein
MSRSLKSHLVWVIKIENQSLLRFAPLLPPPSPSIHPIPRYFSDLSLTSFLARSSSFSFCSGIFRQNWEEDGSTCFPCLHRRRRSSIRPPSCAAFSLSLSYRRAPNPSVSETLAPEAVASSVSSVPAGPAGRALPRLALRCLRRS